MPLVWAHAEHVKLLRSLRDERVFDMPPQVVQRYQVDKTGSDLAVWRFNNMASTLEAGRRLRIELMAPARIRWSVDGWHIVHDVATHQTAFHIFIADLDTASLTPGTVVVFTLRWSSTGDWEGRDFTVRVIEPERAS